MILIIKLHIKNHLLMHHSIKLDSYIILIIKLNIHKIYKLIILIIINIIKSLNNKQLPPLNLNHKPDSL
jgi:hypothetical protein